MPNYFDFPSVSHTPDWLKFVAAILNFNSAPDWLKFVAAILNFNWAPDWLKFEIAILDLENNRFHCSPNNSLLSFSASDWLLPKPTGYTTENIIRFQRKRSNLEEEESTMTRLQSNDADWNIHGL